jgi:SAM-dependent methyltransferase
MIEIINPFNKKAIRTIGLTSCEDADGNKFPVENNIIRFVSGKNYADSFGFQWNKFHDTQMDREDWQLKWSKERLFAATGWQHENLAGKDILEVGSGAGRFSQVVLEETNANLYSIDYSDAISVNYRNNGHHRERLHLFQASIYDMPFPDNSFDKIFCIGVLQHTPNFRKAIKCLADKLRPGGELIVDFYVINGWWTRVQAKYFLRPVTKKLPHDRLLSVIDRNAGWLIGAYEFFDRAGLGRVVNRFIPVCDIRNTLPPNLSAEEKKEWVILDTFDMLSPEHDHPQRISTVSKWFRENNIDVTFAGKITYGGNKYAPIVKGIKRPVK